ncbi:MAG TPA: hypothetical protein VK966_12335, partial [Longimicrobiales bacterium]|nr:hypothetical protein [Longimicrobiales bacterium]
LLALGLGSFLLQARRFYRNRMRPSLDPGMKLAAGGLVVLGAGLVLAWPVVMATATPRVATAYVMLLLLGITLFVAAHYYKIVPFLVWFHRFGPLAGKRPLPRVAELYSGRLASVAVSLLGIGAVTLPVSVLMGHAAATTAAAGLLATGVLVEAGQMAAVARSRP